MVSFEEARAMILGSVQPVGIERIHLLEATGRILAEDVAAPWDMPLWDNSAMDGYAVRAQDTKGATEKTPRFLKVIDTVIAGGISQKDPMTMQIYADVIKMPIKIAGSLQGPALGSAIFAAVAAGKSAGGYDSVFEAARVMGNIKETVYEPIAENVEVYDKLFAEYRTLHDYFGRGDNDVMKRLKTIKKTSK